MSESMQVLPSAGAGASQSKVSSVINGDSIGSTEDPEGFNAVFASYVETEPAVVEQQVDENLTALLNQLLPQDPQLDGNTLPAEEQAAMWQALMLLQPAENAINTSTSTSTFNPLQGSSLLEGQRKPVLSPVLSNQDYFNTIALQNKELTDALPAGFAQNNLSIQPSFTQNNVGIQLAAAHFNPETNDALLLNLNEQMMPVQNTTSTLSQGLAAVGLGTATQAAATQTQMAPLNLGQNAWETNFSSRLQMMVGQNIQTAEIRLDPPELGALDIKINIKNDVASVNITSPNAQVREALETAVPRLREMFEESGVALGDVNVQQESFAQHENAENEEAGISSGVSESTAIDAEEQDIQKRVSNNLLDIYA